jgi:hypothetical protein
MTPNPTLPPVWDVAWAIAGRVERVALSLIPHGDLVADARRDLVVEAAALNRLGIRLVSDAIDRAVQR